MPFEYAWTASQASFTEQDHYMNITLTSMSGSSETFGGSRVRQRTPVNCRRFFDVPRIGEFCALPTSLTFLHELVELVELVDQT